MIALPCPGLLAYAQTGSRYICSPPVSGTDDDYILLVANKTEYIGAAKREGYKLSQKGSCAAFTEFLSFRKGDVNLIVTDNEDFYARFKLATAVAKSLNLLHKVDRVMVFQAILYGVAPQDTTPHAFPA